MPCPWTEHRNNVPTLRGKKHDFSLKSLHQARFETTQHAEILANHYAPTITPRRSLIILIESLLLNREEMFLFNFLNAEKMFSLKPLNIDISCL